MPKLVLIRAHNGSGSNRDFLKYACADVYWKLNFFFLKTLRSLSSEKNTGLQQAETLSFPNNGSQGNINRFTVSHGLRQLENSGCQ